MKKTGAYKKKNLTYRKNKIRTKLAIKKPLTNSYVFKRLGQLIRIAHYNNAPTAQQFTIEDAGDQLAGWGAGTLVAGKIDFAAESMPSTFQNGASMVFRLSSIPAFTDFVSLFDRYKIVGVKLTFMYQTTDFPAGGAPVAPTMLYAADYDDAAAPAYLSLRTKQNVKQKILTGNKPFSIYLRPKKQIGTSSGDVGAVNASTIDSKSWTNMQDQDVNYFGFKFWLNNVYSTTSTNTQLEIRPTYYFAMKDPQ